MESQKIEINWWHKQEDSGRSEFAVSYKDEDGKDRLFYPDWIIKRRNTLWIVDTKAGNTLSSPDTKYKAEALQRWIKDKQGKHNNYKIIGGIVTRQNSFWKINSSDEYNHKKNWQALNFNDR